MDLCYPVGQLDGQIIRLPNRGPAMNIVSNHMPGIAASQQHRVAMSKHPRPWHLGAKEASIEDKRGQTITAADNYPVGPALLEAIRKAVNQLRPSPWSSQQSYVRADWGIRSLEGRR